MLNFKSVAFRTEFVSTVDKEIPIYGHLQIEFENASDCDTFLKKRSLRFFKINGANYMFKPARHAYRFLVAVDDLPLNKVGDIEPSVKEAMITWLRTRYPKAFNYEKFKETDQKPIDPKKEDTIINYSDPKKQPQADKQIPLQKEPKSPILQADKQVLPQKELQTDKQMPPQKEPQADNSIPGQPAQTAYSLDIQYANDAGSYKFYHAKTLKELESDFDFTFDVATLSFSQEQFTKEAKNKIGEILFNYAKKSFSFTKLDIAENILDKKTQDRINALLERNRRFSIRKINIVWFAFFIGIMATSFSMSSLLCILPAVIGVYFYNKHKTRFIDYQEKVLKIELALTLFSVASLSLAFLGPLAFGITLFTALGGLLINHSRDQRIKAAIKKYNDPDLKLNDVERDSLKNGTDAQNSYIPCFNWQRSTWECPEAYNAGYNSPEFIMENKMTP